MAREEAIKWKLNAACFVVQLLIQAQKFQDGTRHFG